jgi:hypothetical protein
MQSLIDQPLNMLESKKEISVSGVAIEQVFTEILLRSYTRSLDVLTAERDGLVAERDGLVAERDGLVAERDGLVQSTIWRASKPIRWLLDGLKKLLGGQK